VSCNYDVLCLDCEDTAGVSYERRPGAIRALIRHAVAIGALAPLTAEEDTVGLSVSAPGPGGSVDIGWFAAHQDHRLVVVDEYGRIEGLCGEHAGPAHERCRLLPGHSGPHRGDGLRQPPGAG